MIWTFTCKRKIPLPCYLQLAHTNKHRWGETAKPIRNQKNIYTKEKVLILYNHFALSELNKWFIIKYNKWKMGINTKPSVWSNTWQFFAMLFGRKWESHPQPIYGLWPSLPLEARVGLEPTHKGFADLRLSILAIVPQMPLPLNATGRQPNYKAKANLFIP